MNERTANYARLTGAALLLGCLLVLRPFLAAILFAGAVCISSWPLYLWLLQRLRGRANLAALTMTLTLSLLVILPLAWMAYNVSDDVARLYVRLKGALESGQLVHPAWIKELPLVGEPLERYLAQLSGDRDELMGLVRRMLEPAKNFLLSAGLLLGGGVLQLSLAAFVSFFLFRDGLAILRVLTLAMQHLIGAQTDKVAGIISRTVRGVMYGLLGTALAQALVAAIGFALAGVPAVPLLSLATFVLSLVPVGPPLIWGGAALWLFDQGQVGWGIFMVVWGMLAISSVDNVVKPVLISRGSSLPFVVVLLGVMGGVLAFGFVGLFIGPALLALGFTLTRDWAGRA